MKDQSLAESKVRLTLMTSAETNSPLIDMSIERKFFNNQLIVSVI